MTPSQAATRPDSSFSLLRQPRITAGELLRALRRAGFYEVRHSGSHIRLRSSDESRAVTVPYHSGQILKPKTLESILSEAGMTVDQLRDLL
ncbi:MAG: type II toxin-antitoxin system HicA family toxin [Candidatus Eremiobacteraeota bacterium]|nr:type II toxin-antitoxin system HicA family toxin [Candidatus Eremiobacteraeota bacterium]